MPLQSGFSKSDLAYCAGIIDGEGSIGASPSFHSKNNYRVMLIVAMTTSVAIQELQRVFGGKVSLESRLTKTGKPIYKWGLYCKKAAICLEQLIPYLKVKKEQALDAILLARLHRRSGWWGKGHRIIQISDDELNKRQEIYHRLRERNFRSNGRIASHATSERIIA